MSAFWVWTLTIVFFLALGLITFAIMRATNKSRTAAIRDADADHTLGHAAKQEQPGFVTPYRA
jgi:hypothetical protein